MKPRASMTNDLVDPGIAQWFDQGVDRLRRKRVWSARTGVMSSKSAPGCGKSGCVPDRAASIRRDRSDSHATARPIARGLSRVRRR